MLVKLNAKYLAKFCELASLRLPMLARLRLPLLLLRLTGGSSATAEEAGGGEAVLDPLDARLLLLRWPPLLAGMRGGGCSGGLPPLPLLT